MRPWERKFVNFCFLVALPYMLGLVVFFNWIGSK